MWLIITQGNPEQKRKAKWLSIFLESWYNENEFKTLSGFHIERLKSGNITENDILIYSKALSQSKYITLEERDTIIKLTKEANNTKAEDKLIMLPELSENITKNIIKHIQEGNYNKAITCIHEIENEADGIKFGLLGICYAELKDYHNARKNFLLAIEKGHVGTVFNLALLYDNQEKHKDAEKYYLLAIEKGDVNALFNLALLYSIQEKYEDAEKYYLFAIEKGDVGALFNLALLYDNQEKYEYAEKYYLLAIEKGHVNALFNLALLYDNQEKYEYAEKYYLLAIEKGHVNALFNLALLYSIQEKYEEAERYLLLSIENGKNDALFILAWMYFLLGRLEDAEKYYLKATEIGNTDALLHLASLHHKKENYEEAEKYYLLGINSGKISGYNDLGYMYYQTNSNKSQALESINKACSLDPNPIYKETQIIIEIWNGIFKDLENRVVDVIKEKNLENIEELIQDLLIQQQKTLVLSLFHHAEIGKNLQDKYMVFYYVTLIINNQLENNLMLRIPPELQTTIDDVIAKIKERQNFYGYII